MLHFLWPRLFLFHLHRTHSLLALYRHVHFPFSSRLSDIAWMRWLRMAGNDWLLVGGTWLLVGQC